MQKLKMMYWSGFFNIVQVPKKKINDVFLGDFSPLIYPTLDCIQIPDLCSQFPQKRE